MKSTDYFCSDPARVAVDMDIHEYIHEYIHVWISDLAHPMDIYV